MASVEVQLSATPSLVTLDAPAQRVVVTITSAAAEVVATADGSYPSLPSSVENTTPVTTIAGVLGNQGVLKPPIPDGHAAIPTIRLASKGNPTVLVEW